MLFPFTFFVQLFLSRSFMSNLLLLPVLQLDFSVFWRSCFMPRCIRTLTMSHGLHLDPKINGKSWHSACQGIQGGFSEACSLHLLNFFENCQKLSIPQHFRCLIWLQKALDSPCGFGTLGYFLTFKFDFETAKGYLLRGIPQTKLSKNLPHLPKCQGSV